MLGVTIVVNDFPYGLKNWLPFDGLAATTVLLTLWETVPKKMSPSKYLAILLPKNSNVISVSVRSHLRFTGGGIGNVWIQVG